MEINTQSDAPPLPRLNPRHILLLDDDPDLVSVLRDCLEERDFLVTTATDGVEGLRAVMAQDFDVILCDLMMPSVPGDMFYAAVQRTKPFLNARFIFITGCSDNPRVESFLQNVSAPVLLKPLKTEDIHRTVDQLMG